MGRKTTKTSSKATPSRQYDSSDEEPAIQHNALPNILLEDADHYTRFDNLLAHPIRPTRFMCEASMRNLGVYDSLCEVLVGTGMEGLVTMMEYTYRDLTLEFFSSFSYTARGTGTVHFQLCNRSHSFSLYDFGRLLGVSTSGYLRDVPRDGHGVLWRSLTGLDYTGNNMKFRANLIHHPVFRIWARLVGGTFFGRPEPNNLKTAEVSTLAAFLNLDRGERFSINMAHFVAKHFESIAKGHVLEILAGGVVTHLAKRLQRNDFDPYHWVLVGEFGPPGSHAQTQLDSSCRLNIPHLIFLHYLRRREGRSRTWWWRLGNTDIILLPDRLGRLPEVRALTVAPGIPIDSEYYLIPVPPPDTDTTRTFETGQSSQPTHDPPSFQEGPPNTTYPPFSHDPFMQPPYPTSYYDPTTFPPNYNPYPPFNRPAVWNEDSTPSMIWGLCTQMQRMGTDLSLAAYHGYEAQVRSGQIAPNAHHPSFYSYPQWGYDNQGQGSGYGDQAGPSGYGGQGAQQDDDDEEDHDARDDDDARYGGSP